MRPPLFGLRRAALLGLAGLAVLGLRAAEPRLTIVYDGQTTAFAGAEISMMPHQDVTAFDAHEKQNHVYSGVPVRDLLAKAGISFGEKLRGKFLRLAVIAHCRDNYDIVYALAEFDDAFNDRTILLVDRQDGQPLPDGMGPVRLFIPGDKRPARWARMVTSLELVPVGNPGPRAPKPAAAPAPAP
jgi:Oxidoreductase molybdopterin binding domain